MSEEARLDLSKVTIPEAVKNYPPEKRQEVMDYLSEMDEQHRQAYEIALNHLELNSEPNTLGFTSAFY